MKAAAENIVVSAIEAGNESSEKLERSVWHRNNSEMKLKMA